MKKITLIPIAVLLITVFISCGKGTGKQSATADGFSEIEKEIKNEFGDGAYFTEVSVTYNRALGNIIGITVTKAPESLKMEQWNLIQGNWKQNTEISLEVPQGSKAADFMFQLNEKMNLSKLGELVEISRKQLEDEKSIENPTLNTAYIFFPKNGDISKAEYYVNLKPENGGTSFRFRYKLNGDFIETDN